MSSLCIYFNLSRAILFFLLTRVVTWYGFRISFWVFLIPSGLIFSEAFFFIHRVLSIFLLFTIRLVSTLICFATSAQIQGTCHCPDFLSSLTNSRMKWSISPKVPSISTLEITSSLVRTRSLILLYWFVHLLNVSFSSFGGQESASRCYDNWNSPITIISYLWIKVVIYFQNFA